MKLVTVSEMMDAERGAGVPISQLMANAGLAVAEEARRLLGESLSGRQVLVLVGPGNNGGDGLVAARRLKEWGADVSAYLLRPRPEEDDVYRAALRSNMRTLQVGEDSEYRALEEMLTSADLVIDALLGTGRARAIEGPLAEALDRLRQARSRSPSPRLVALDLPTGLDADTGAADDHCVPADETVTLGWSKVGLHLLPGSQYTGKIIVRDIGIPKQLEPAFRTELMTEDWAQASLPARPLGGHKGTFGTALVVAGSPRYIGAAALAAVGALRSGAGLVSLACAQSIHPILASKLTESTFLPLPDEDGCLGPASAYTLSREMVRPEARYNSLLAGPGLSQGPSVPGFMRALLAHLPESGLRAVVIDADGLNNLSKIGDWAEHLTLPAILTPHPGELSRLSGLGIKEIQSDRAGVARRYASEWGVTLILKGANTVVASPEGSIRISPFANPGLASGGTGDVLAGVIVGLLAQGLEPFDAASLGVYLHGLAGELVRKDLGDAGMIAGDLLPALPRAIKALRGGEPRA